MPNSWLPQVAGLYLSSPFCKFPTYFSTANWGILNEFNISIKTESDMKINSSPVVRGKAMLPQIVVFSFKKILQKGAFNHKPKLWLPQVAGF